MELKEYIKQSYLRPNKQVLKSLGASDELIEYLKTTPWNTNLNIVDSLSESGEDKSTKIHIVLTKQSRYDEEYDEVWTWFTGSVQLNEPLTSTGQCTISYQKGENNLTISDDDFLILRYTEINGVYINLEQDRKTITCSSDETNNSEPNNEIIINIEIN